MTAQDHSDPNKYVRENKETLVDIIKHSNDTFVRSLCMAAIAEYGDNPDIGEIKQELERFAEREESDDD